METDSAELDLLRAHPGGIPKGNHRYIQFAGGALIALAAISLIAMPARYSRREAHDASVVATESKIVMGGCHTAVQGETCWESVMWVKQTGVNLYPDQYPGLSSLSRFEEFQTYLNKVQSGDCPMPCGGPFGPPQPSSMVPGSPTTQSCLCLFDVDRTLTAKQGLVSQCPASQVIPGVFDDAFTGGELTLSPLGQAIGRTFCGACHLGVVSAGGAGGPDEKAVLQTHLPGFGAASVTWSGPNAISSPLVIGCSNALKAQCAQGIVDWYRTARNVVIPPQEVYFFDDLTGNTNGFANYGFNARQVSCGSRDGNTGLCGADLSEIVRIPGISNCWKHMVV